MKIPKIPVLTAALGLFAFSAQATIVVHGGGGATTDGTTTRLCPDPCGCTCATISANQMQVGDLVAVTYMAENGEEVSSQATVVEIAGQADPEGNYEGQQLRFQLQE